MNSFDHLMIIDDEAEIGELLTSLFGDMFAKISVFTNGPAALAFAKSDQTVNAILTDVFMPEMTGDQLIRSLRAAGLQTPVFFLTGYSTKALVLSALRLGAADFFEKPFSSDVLRESVGRVLEIEKRRAQLIDMIASGKPAEEILKMRRMVGLLQVANEVKKTA